MWHYKSAVGMLRIVKLPDGISYFQFRDDDTCWTGHKNPQVVVSDAFNHVTGCSDWDMSNANCPESIADWIPG